MRVMLVGGGTGGHFYPLIAIGDALIEEASSNGRRLELYYIGPEPYDPVSLQTRNISFVRCTAGKIRRYSSPLNILDGFKTLIGLFVAVLKLYIIYPDVIMSKGSYTSVPVVLAARFLRIPVVVHESDVSPGRANRLSAKFARYIGVSYRETAGEFTHTKAQVALVGVPVRREILSALNSSVGSTPSTPVILVLGGSQGAQRINELILESIEELTERYQIIHQTGKASYETVRASAAALLSSQPHAERYQAVASFDPEKLGEALHHASIVISRAGSGSIFEIAAFGKASILIPIPEDISHDQTKNAYAYARLGGATVMEQRNLTTNILTAEINRILNTPSVKAEYERAARAFFIPDGDKALAQALLGIGIEHGS